VILRAAPVAVLVAALASSTPGPSPADHDSSGLPVIGEAPDFDLRAEDGTKVALRHYRGKVVAVTFIFASCSATCPTMTAKMATVQDDLETAFGPKVAFLSITVDPEHDTPEVLKDYAHAFGANSVGWHFLTGSPRAIADVKRRYGVFAANSPDRELEHTNLISIIDPRGKLRVQYLGVRFDPDELRRDLLSLVER
jgi:protein SCO1/2